MKFHFLSIALFSLGLASAQASSSANLSSGLCSNEQSQLKTRVLIFSHENATYALASDQAVFNDSQDKSQNICHFVEFEGKLIQARLLVHDPLSGLAILKLNVFFSSVEDFPEIANAKNREELIIDGQAKSTTKVLQESSKRHFFAGLDFALEAKGPGLPPNFSQLGSPVFNGSGQLVGFLSRYYLMYRPGLSTYVRRWTPKTTTKSFGYILLPSQYALNWVKKVLRNGNSPHDWQLNLTRQLQGEYILDGTSLSVVEGESPNEKDLEGEGPIGGIDGVGIGGIDTAFSLHKISFLPKEGNPDLLPIALRSLGQSIRSEKILSLAYQGEKNAFGFEPVRVYSLDSFLALALTNPKLKIFTQLKNQLTEKDELGARALWVENLETKNKFDWQWRWQEIKSTPRLLSAFYRCIFYLAWLKSDSSNDFPVSDWRNEFDPNWGKEAVWSIRFLLSDQENVIKSWESLWAQ